MYEWTLTTIRSKVRSITGYLSTGQMADTALDGYINQAYQNELPRLLGHTQFHSWFTFNTADGDGGEYTIDALASDDGANIIAFDGSYITIDDADASVYYDRAAFFAIWPEGETYTEGTPTDILIEGRKIWLRTIPDDAYEVKIPVTRKCPEALEEATDKPLDPSWGPLIAFIAAEIILLEKGRDVSTAEAGKRYYLSLAGYDDAHRLSGQRAAPRW